MPIKQSSNKLEINPMGFTVIAAHMNFLQLNTHWGTGELMEK